MSSTLYDTIGQFTTIPNAIIEHTSEIGVDALAIFVYLRYRTHSKRGVAFPSYDRIREDTGMSFHRIADAIRTLIDCGACERVRRFGKSTEYTLKVPHLWIIEGNEEVQESLQKPNESTVLHTVEGQSCGRVQTINTELINTEEKTIVANATSGTQFPVAEEIAEFRREKHSNVVRELTHYQKTVKELTMWFADRSGIRFVEPNSDRDKKEANVRWWMPLWVIYKSHCDQDMELTKSILSKAYDHLRENGLTVSSPASVKNVAIALIAAKRNKKVIVVQ